MAISLAPSAPPTSVSVSEVTSSSITVQWGPVDCIHRNGDITGYTVRVSASGEGERAVSVDESVSEATVTGLTLVNTMCQWQQRTELVLDCTVVVLPYKLEVSFHN